MDEDIKYAGFWIRFIASFLDTFFLALPIGIVIYFLSSGEWFDFAQYQQNIFYAMNGDASSALSNQPKTSLKWEFLFEFSVLFVTLVFWEKWGGTTPGKRVMNIKIVDSITFKDIDNKQAITRSIGYIASALVFFLGFIMIAFRKDKKGLHDILARTVVIYEQH